MPRTKKNKNIKLVFTDSHITEDSMQELDSIFSEIVQQKADELVFAGDYYEKNRPTAKELLFGTQWAHTFKKKFKKVYFLRGNHDKVQDISAVDYLRELDIDIVDEYKKDGLFVGHFMVNESQLAYGTGGCSVTDLKTNKLTILGHQHSRQQLAHNVYHLGSIRYVNFNEAKDENKFIAKIDGKNHIHFIKLKNLIPMYDVYSVKELEDVPTGMIKVRVILKSFDQMKREIDILNKVKHKYNIFKIKLDFEKTKTLKTNMSNSLVKTKLKDILKEGIKKIKDKDVKNLLKGILNESNN